MLKEFLSQKGVPYRERDVSRDYAAGQELLARTGQTGVPVIIIDGQTIIGFNRARLEQILAQSRPSLGAAVADASRVAGPGSGVNYGAHIGSVRPGSAAERMGLRRGDIIIELNGRRVANAAGLQQTLLSLSRGSRVSLVFIREGNRLSTEGAL